MSNKKVTLVRLCKTAEGWRRYPAVIGKNGRLKPGFALVAGVERHFPEGRYQIRCYEGSRMIYKDAGEQGSDALAERDRAARLLLAKEAVQAAGVKIEAQDERIHLRRALDKFIVATQDRGSTEAAEVYQSAAEEFMTITGAVYADEITPELISKHQGALRKRGLADRTVANRHNRLMAFLRYLKLDTKALAPTKPRYEEALPEVYDEEELRQFFTACDDPKLALAYELLLKTGMREQEAIHLTWASVDFDRRVLRVRSNPEYGFKVKDKEQRDVPLAADLADRLRARKKEKGGKLVLGTDSDQPNTKLLRSLKRAAKRAGVNCGHCPTCVEKGECEHWFLHKFRATYITKLLRTGMDLRTVMKLSGHSDLESVMRYLSPASDAAIQSHVSAIVWM